MLGCYKLTAVTVAAILISSSLAGAQPAKSLLIEPISPALATKHINDLGVENGESARAVGSWDVTETVWDSANAAPIVARGLIAERRMVGSFLEETLRSIFDPGKTLRVDYLTFNRVEGRWEYVSMDTRAAVGMMTAQSYDRGELGKIELSFQPFSVPGPGPNVSGQMLRMREEIRSQTPNSDRKDQYFTVSDGKGVEWLAHRYAYVRRK